jgi:hypothetical protein
LEIVKIIDDQLQAYSKVRTLHDNEHRSIRQLVWSLFGLASETVALPTSLVDHEDEE